MTTVMVSGCYDVLHAGHLRFLEDARALGDRLYVCVAGDEVVRRHKGRLPAMPAQHKATLLRALPCVDVVEITAAGQGLGMDFEPAFRRVRPHVLAVTEDDRYEPLKRALCADVGGEYVRIPKAPPTAPPISTTEIRRRCAAPSWVPVRVDFAGGWFDVPKLARDGALVVNMAVTPGMSLADNPYHAGGGIGGSAAWAMLNGQDPLEAELAAGVGWQDPAILLETGLCVWLSGLRPRLLRRYPCEWLAGRLAILWTNGTHVTADLVDRPRDYDRLAVAGTLAAIAVAAPDDETLAEAVEEGYQVQLGEGMAPLPFFGEGARKYLGAGHGGYGLYLFGGRKQRDEFVAAQADAMAVEPFDRWNTDEPAS